MSEEAERVAKIFFLQVLLAVSKHFPTFAEKVELVGSVLLFLAFCGGILVLCGSIIDALRERLQQEQRGLPYLAGKVFSKAWTRIRIQVRRLPALERPALTPGFRLCFCGVGALLAFAYFGAHSYNFYVLLRWVVAISLGTALLRFFHLWDGYSRAAVGAVAVVFNPVSPFHFSRYTWGMLNIVAAAVLLVFALQSRAVSQEAVEA